MELLAFPRNEHLLDASLETLHAESREWVKELEFWSDELSFFYKLLRTKQSRDVFPALDLAALEKKLIGINSEILSRLRDGVASHERLLSSLIKSASLADEGAYRETHHRLRVEIQDLAALIRAFKKDVFDFYAG